MNPYKLEQDYLEAVLKDPGIYRQEEGRLREAVRESEAWYKGKPVPALFHPRLVTPDQLEDFRSLIAASNAIFAKVIRRYEEDPAYRAAFAFPSLLEELILLPTPLSWPIPMARYDIFYRGPGDFTFCEINTDGTSAMNEDRALTEIFLQSRGAGLIAPLRPFRFELFDSWAASFASHFPQGALRYVVILDIGDISGNFEFLRFRDTFRAAGIGCDLAGPDELDFDGEWLRLRGRRVDAVYRRLVTSDLYAHLSEMGAVIEAMKKGKTVWVGPVKTQIVHNKRIFAVLHREEFWDMFSLEEQDFIRRHIPYTAELTAERLGALRARKDEFLLKPADSYAARGVISGRELSREEWERRLEELAGTGYLLQRFAEIPSYPCIDFTAEGYVAEYRHITGLYVYGGELAGIYSRASRSEIIADQYGAKTLPTFGVRHA